MRATETNLTTCKAIIVAGVCLVEPRLIRDCCECTGRNDQVLFGSLVSPPHRTMFGREDVADERWKKRIADGPYSGDGDGQHDASWKEGGLGSYPMSWWMICNANRGFGAGIKTEWKSQGLGEDQVVLTGDFRLWLFYKISRYFGITIWIQNFKKR